MENKENEMADLDRYNKHIEEINQMETIKTDVCNFIANEIEIVEEIRLLQKKLDEAELQLKHELLQQGF